MNKNVVAFNGTCRGIMIKETKYYGEIVKENKSSIVVQFNRFTVKEGRGGLVEERTYGGTYNFRYWKTVDGIKYFKNSIYGIIEIPEEV